jgi:hypothetical protein
LRPNQARRFSKFRLYIGDENALWAKKQRREGKDPKEETSQNIHKTFMADFRTIPVALMV